MLEASVHHTDAEIRSILRDWIARASGDLVPGELRDDTPILERGIITSVDAMELILLIESLCGAEIDVRRLDPGSLATVDSICRTFFADGVEPTGRPR